MLTAAIKGYLHLWFQAKTIRKHSKRSCPTLVWNASECPGTSRLKGSFTEAKRTLVGFAVCFLPYVLGEVGPRSMSRPHFPSIQHREFEAGEVRTKNDVPGLCSRKSR